MAQHDYNLANQTGADFRADLNNALSAIATVNSGASEPSTTFAHQLWVDTSNNLLKIRNAANSAFITTGISITADNVFTGALTGNASTATTLATARTINGTSFDGSANISFNTDSVAEGSSNLYFTNERVDDQVNALLQAGTGIQLTYDDTAGTLTIANTNDADITGVVAGNALTGGGTSGSVTLNVAVDDSSIEIDSDALRVKASGITNTMLAGSIANSKLTNSGVTINSQSLSLGGTLVLDTDNIGEGSSNLYYTDARARAAISENSNQLSYNSTTGVLTYTQGDTDTVSEGSSNLYYTQARFDTAFGNKTTADLTENTNLYYTDTRANSAIDARVTNTFINNLSGVVADTSTALATARTIALSGDVVGSVSFDGTADVTIASTIQANSVALGTDTTGNYIQTITGTANKITVSGSGSESADVTLTLPDNVQVANDLTVAGNLTVNGTLTSLDTTNLDIEDNLFQLNAGLTGSPVNDSGMLINRGNQNNGIFMWDESVDKFTLGLTTADGTSTGNITLASLGTLVANVEGNVTGTIQTAAQPNITSLGTLTGLTTTGDINFGDNDKAVFGAGSDLQIYHDGSNSFIQDAGTGTLRILSDDVRIMNAAGTEISAQFLQDGEARLKYDNSTKLATKSTGIDVTGVITTDGLTTSADINFGDNDKAVFGAGSDLQIYHDGSNSFIKDSGTGSLLIDASNLYLRNSSGEEYASFIADGAANLKYNGSTRIVTSSAGIDVTGTATMDGLTVDSGTTNTVATFTSTDAGAGIQLTDSTGSSKLETSGANLRISVDDDGAVASSAIQFRVDGSTKATLNSSGNLGLGTSPTTPLHVYHATTDTVANFQSGDNSVAVNFTASDNSMQIATSNTDGILKNNGAGSLRFFNNGSEAARIDSSGNLGLGTTSPTGDGTALHIHGSTHSTLHLTNSTTGSAVSDGFDIITDGSDALLRNREDAAIKFRIGSSEVLRMNSTGVAIGTDSPDSNVKLDLNSGTNNVALGIQSTDSGAYVAFKDSGTTGTYGAAAVAVGAISDNLLFRAGSAERMRIDSSGNLLIGQTTGNVYNQSSVSGFKLDGANGNLQIARSGNTVAFFNRMTSDGTIADFRKDGTSVGAINTVSDDLAILSSISGHKGLRFGSGAITPTTNTAAIDNGNTDLGGNSIRFKDLYLAGTANVGGLTVDGDATSAGTIGVVADGGTLSTGKDSSSTRTQIAMYNPTGQVAKFDTNSDDLLLNVADNFRIYTAASERLRLDASGNFYVGTTDTTLYSATSGGGIYAVPNGSTTIARQSTSSTQPLFILNETGVDGTLQEFRKDGSIIGSIGVNGGRPYLVNSVDGGIHLSTDGYGRALLLPADQNGAPEDNLHYLGSSSYRWRDIYLSGSIDFNSAAVFTVNSAERARIDSSGNLLVGTTTSSLYNQSSTEGVAIHSDHIQIARSSNICFTPNRYGTDGDIIQFRKDGSTVGSIGTNTGDIFLGTGDTFLRFNDSLDSVLPATATGAGRDNATDLGYSGGRFKDIYATNGTIQTSDINEKQDIEDLTDAETRVAVAAKSLLKKYRWKSAVEEKGDDARIHFGIMAQDLQNAFTAEGLDAGDYAMFISSTWTDDDGVEQTRLGVRYSELLAFIIAAI